MLGKRQSPAPQKSLWDRPRGQRLKESKDSRLAVPCPARGCQRGSRFLTNSWTTTGGKVRLREEGWLAPQTLAELLSRKVHNGGSRAGPSSSIYKPVVFFHEKSNTGNPASSLDAGPSCPPPNVSMQPPLGQFSRTDHSLPLGSCFLPTLYHHSLSGK
jgi:hypothetical protein